MSKIVTVAIVIVLAVIGWFGIITTVTSGNNEYENALSQAETYMEHELYQLAISEYKKCLGIKDSTEVWTDLFFAYEERIKEDAGLVKDFQTLLKEYVSSHGYPVDYVTGLALLYQRTGNHIEAYDILNNAIANGVSQDDIEASYNDFLGEIKEAAQKRIKFVEESEGEPEKIADVYGVLSRVIEQLTTEPDTKETSINYVNSVKYGYKIRSIGYLDFLPVSNNVYSVYNGTSWSRINSDGSQINNKRYIYVSQLNHDGIALYTNEKDSRLINSSGVVQGIFKKQITDAGLYSDGLIAINNDGNWDYYNNFAEKQFGGYDEAGTFVDGRAAVKQDGKWYVIKKDGKEDTDKRFDDMRLSLVGQYNVNSVILASEGGKYHLYNSEYGIIGDFSCDNIDISTNDGLIAFKTGDKWGFVDTKGKVVIEPIYEQAKSFSNGLAAVCVNGKWGFVNKQGVIVIKPQFSDADYFNSSGACMVRSPNINNEGEYYWQLLKLNIGILGDSK